MHVDRIRVLVIDDQRAIREGWRAIMAATDDFEAVALAETPDKAVELIRQHNVDVVFLDMATGFMQIRPAKKAARLISERCPEVKIVLLTAYPQLLATAYQLPNHLVIARGGTVDDLEILDQVRDLLREGDPEPIRDLDLTERQAIVLNLLAQGLTNKQIAAQLIISERTVKGHVTEIFSKFGVDNRTEATRRAIELGLVSLDSPR